MSPASSAAASVRPTAPTCGSVKITRGDAPPSERRRTSLPRIPIRREPRLVLPHVREQRAAVDVADRVEPVAPVDAERLVGLDVPAGLETDRLQPDVARPRPPADRDEDLVRLDRRAVVELDADGAVPGDRRRRRAEPDVDAAVAKRRQHLLAREPLLPLDQPLAPVDERHLRAERRPRLRHLDPDHAAAEDRQPRRHLLRGRRLDVRPRRCVGEARAAAGSPPRCPSRSRRRAARRAPPRPTSTRFSPASRPWPRTSVTPRSSSQGTIEESSRSWTTSSRRASTASTSSSPTATPGTRRASAASSPGRQKRLRRHAGEEGALAARRAAPPRSPPRGRLLPSRPAATSPGAPAPITTTSNSRSLTSNLPLSTPVGHLRPTRVPPA